MDFQEIKNSPQKKQLFFVFGLLLCVFLAVLVISTGVDVVNKIKQGMFIGRDIAARNMITVSGTGDIYATPDLAVIDFSVVSEAKTVAEAMTDNTNKINAIINAVKNQGVEDKDLKTTNFNISPRYEWQYQEICLVPPCPSGTRVLVGYDVTQTLEVKIRDLTKTGGIIQQATAAGANQAGDLQFTFDNQDALLSQAREQAIQEAKSKAKDLASQLGVKLVRIANFSEGSVTPFSPTYLKGEAVGMGGAAPVPQIETGQNKVSVTVSITYEIN
jgi:uncharacterized protein YggE